MPRLAIICLTRRRRLRSPQLLYPTRRIKVTRQSYKAQLKSGEITQEQADAMDKKGNMAMLADMVKTGGFFSIWNGLFLELFRGVLSGSIMLSVKVAHSLLTHCLARTPPSKGARAPIRLLLIVCVVAGNAHAHRQDRTLLGFRECRPSRRLARPPRLRVACASRTPRRRHGREVREEAAFSVEQDSSTFSNKQPPLFTTNAKGPVGSGAGVHVSTLVFTW